MGVFCGVNGLLVQKGSVYDLTATYIMLLEDRESLTSSRQKDIMKMFCTFLDNGHTYEILQKEILKSFHNHVPFPIAKFSKIYNGDGCNLVKQGTIYYHKELKIMNSLPMIHHDVDSGTITNSQAEYYVEPVASYTLDDLLQYFYSKNIADTVEFNYKRMYGMFRHKLGVYGLDKLLFMIEAATRACEANNRPFTLDNFDSHNQMASQYLEEIKNNCKFAGGENLYVKRKRMLPM